MRGRNGGGRAGSFLGRLSHATGVGNPGGEGSTQPSMRIMIAGQTYDPKINGPGVFTLHLAEGLARRGHEVMMITPSNRRRAYGSLVNGVRIRAISAVSLAPLYREVYVTPRP